MGLQLSVGWWMEAVFAVDGVGVGVLLFEGFGYAGTPGALGVACVDKDAVGWSGEDVAYALGDKSHCSLRIDALFVCW